MAEPTFEYKSPTHGANFNEMREKWCDVTIIVNDIKYRAHKIVLAANLKYFKTRLLHPQEDSDPDIIDMTEVDVKDLAAFILYAYTGKILLTIGNVRSLLADAHKLNEDKIKEACVTFLRKHLRVEDACLIYKFADTVDSALLKDAAAATIIKNFEVCSLTTAFLDFNYESLKGIFCVANSDTKSQQILFEGIMRWVMHYECSRWLDVKSLLSLIDVTKLTTKYWMDYLRYIVRNNDPYCSDVVKHLIQCYDTSMCLKEKQRTVLILQQSNEKLEFQYYDLIDRKWSPVKGILLHRTVGSICDSAVLDDKLYYITSYGHAYMFDFTAEKIFFLSKKVNQNLCACRKFLYLCGIYPNELRRYEPQTDILEGFAHVIWENINKSAVIFYEDGIYVLGGIDLHQDITRKSVVKYNLQTDKWEDIPPMCEGRCNHAVAVLDGKLYACGGLNMNSVEVYEPATKSWRKVRNMNKQRRNFLALAYERKLFAIGGDTEKTIDVYDPSKDQWQIDQEASSGLQITHPRGGLISDKCLQQRVLKRPPEPTNESPPNTGDDDREVQEPSKKSNTSHVFNHTQRGIE